MTLDEALQGKEIPDEIRERLILVTVPFLGFDHEVHYGQLIIDKDLASEVTEIFQVLFDAGFPIEKMIPVSQYDWSDDISMADNNSSAFNYRLIYGTLTLSNHSFGNAIDINPILNPYIAVDGTVHPSMATYDATKPGTILDGGIVVQTFEKYGWEWGGRWTNRKDYQHFQKILKPV